MTMGEPSPSGEGIPSGPDLIVDAVYAGGRSGDAGDDPLHDLLGVSSQGGFRYLGTRVQPRLLVLTSSFDDPDWPDHLDPVLGTLTYYGDNKRPGRDLHHTPRFGNVLLRDIFGATHANPPRRAEVPPVLVFGRAGAYRDMVFRGLAVPGSRRLTESEDLVAVWKSSGGRRFQNYRAIFTILDVPSVSREWLSRVVRGDAEARPVPYAWAHWVRTGVALSLNAEPTLQWRRKADQLPSTKRGELMLATLYDYFAEEPTVFEACAAKLAQLMDPNFLSFAITRPVRDGGRDAIGRYRVGLGASAIEVDFALEAKCYRPGNAVGVRELSRLISRIRPRQFGVLVTTSHLNEQAYQELKEDGHPIIVISGRDIIDVLAKAGYSRRDDLLTWLHTSFPRPSAAGQPAAESSA